MEAIPFKVHFPENASLHIQENVQPVPYGVYHLHPEIQISLILAGSGHLHLDKANIPFQEKDILVIPPNLPHAFNKEVGASHSHIISIFFLPTVFEKTFFQLGEMRKLRQFFNDFSIGLKITDRENPKLSNLIQTLKEMPDALQLSRLIQILYLIVNHQRKVLLKTNRWQYLAARSKQLYARLEPVFEYVQANLEQSIRLEEVAKLSHMSQSSFSRYFKKCTRKSFSNYLNEMRIQKACKLLRETDFSIYRISLETGFRNLSNFNRHFKRIVELTPSQFRSRALSTGDLD